MKYQNIELVAKNVTLGAFSLPDSLKEKINKKTNFTPNKTPASFDGTIKLIDSYYFIGKDLEKPEIGDMKIKFKIVEPQNVSVIAKQVGSSFGPYQTPFGTYEQLVSENVGVDSMIASAKASNSTITWILRIIGFLLMMIALGMVFKPFSVIADVVPFIGSFVEIGIGILSFFITATCTLLTIGVAWIFYRPLIGIPLVAVAIGLIMMIFMKRNKVTK